MKRTLIIIFSICFFANFISLFGQKSFTVGVLAGTDYNSIDVSESNSPTAQTKGKFGAKFGILFDKKISLNSGLKYLNFEGIFAYKWNKIDVTSNMLDISARENKLELKPILSFTLGKKDIKPRFSIGCDVGLNFSSDVKIDNQELKSFKSKVTSQGILGLGLIYKERVLLFARYHYRILPRTEGESILSLSGIIIDNQQPPLPNATTTVIKWNPMTISFGMAYLFLNH